MDYNKIIDKEEVKICLSCGEIFHGKNLHDIVCPKCGYKIKFIDYDRRISRAREAVHYGYHYRLVYEENLKKNIEIRYWLLPLSDVLSFIALAIVSGVIGNASYAATNKIIEKAKEYLIKSNQQESEAWKIINDKDKMKQFAKNIEAFYNELDGADEEVKAAIYEEMIVHKSMDTIDTMIASKYTDLNVERIKEDLNCSDEECFTNILQMKKRLNKSEGEVKKIMKKKGMEKSLYSNLWNRLEEEYKQKKIFLSYCQKDSDIADLVDRGLSDKIEGKAIISRDIRDVKYHQSFKVFMESIEKHDFVIMIISDRYLKSRNCLFEVLEVIKSSNYKNKLAFIVLCNEDKKYINDKDQDNIGADIYSSGGQTKYCLYWKNIESELQKQIDEIGDATYAIAQIKEMKIIKHILLDMHELLEFIKDSKGIPLEQHIENGFSDIIKFMKLETN